MRRFGPPCDSKRLAQAPGGRRRVRRISSRRRIQTQRFSLQGSAKRGANPQNQKPYLAGVVPLLKSPAEPWAAPLSGYFSALPAAGVFFFFVRFLFFFWRPACRRPLRVRLLQRRAGSGCRRKAGARWRTGPGPAAKGLCLRGRRRSGSPEGLAWRSFFSWSWGGLWQGGGAWLHALRGIAIFPLQTPGYGRTTSRVRRSLCR